MKKGKSGLKQKESSNKERETKSRSKSQKRSRSRGKFEEESEAKKNKSSQKSSEIKSSIFISNTLKEESNVKNKPLFSQKNKQNDIDYINAKLSETLIQSFSDNQILNYQEELPVSQEGFKNKGIINDFKDIPSYLDDLNDLTLFDKKEEAENNLETNKYNIEQLLLMDQTNKKLQKEYISVAVKLFNSEKDETKIEILKEKIKKAGIILDEDVYKNEIKKISNYQKNFDYINFRERFFETLKYIIKEESNKIEAKNKLKIEKIFQFNQPAELGNNNYYFYGLCIQLRNKIDEIFLSSNLYLKFIEEFISFAENKNFDKLTKREKFLFNYQLEILLDKESMANKDELDNIMNFLNGVKVDENEIVKAVKLSKSNNNLIYGKCNEMIYDLNYDKISKELKFLIKEERKIFKKMHNFQKTYSYKIDNFNKNIIKMIKKEFDHNLESKLFENVLPNENCINDLLKEIKPEFERMVKNILSSQAAENFFNEHYKSKYKNLKYQFNRDKVQDKILKEITFAPIFHKEDKAITNPIDLSIIITSVPGKFRSHNIPIFIRKILILGNYILFAIHEILGHYCRRYYSYFTGQIININTNEDFEIQTGDESGYYVESEFLGIKLRYSLSITEALSFFYWKKFDSYPIIDKNYDFKLDEEKMKIIKESNNNVFNFIKNNNDDEEGEITIKEYLELVSYSCKKSSYSRIHCPQSNIYYIYWYE